MPHADVIIIGSGFAGLTCAIEASSLGMSVIILEKMGSIGGNSTISDGGIAAPNTDLQKGRNIIDSPELMAKDMLTAGNHLNDQALVEQIAAKANEAFMWSIDALKVPYMDRVDLFGGHSVARCYTPEGITGKTIIDCMLKVLKDRNIIVKTKSYVQDFLFDEKNSVQGLSVLDDYSFHTKEGKTKTTYTATKAVVVASGGFGHDKAFIEKNTSKALASLDSTNKKSATGELLTCLANHGVRLIDLKEVQLGPWGSPKEKGFGRGPLFADYLVLPYGVLIDPYTGKRFVNESADRKIVSDALITLSSFALGIVDSDVIEKQQWDFSYHLNKGIVRTFDSLEAIASAYQMNSKTFQSTIDRYHDTMKNSTDDFGRPNNNIMPIKRSPFYVMDIVPKIHHTMGGIKINTQGQVYHQSGKIIPKLYAIGEVTGGVHGASRLGSCAVTECLVMGRIAAQTIANNNN